MNEEAQVIEVVFESMKYSVELGIRAIVALKNIAALIFYKTSNWHDKKRDKRLSNKKGNVKQKTMDKITKDVSFFKVGQEDLRFFEKYCKKMNVPYTALTELKEGKEYIHVMFPTNRAAQVHLIEEMIKNKHLAAGKKYNNGRETMEEFIKDTKADKPDWLKKNFPDIHKEVEKIKKKENVKVPDKNIKEIQLAMYKKTKTNNLSKQMKRNDFSIISAQLKDCVGMKRNENKEITHISFLIDKKHTIEVSTDKVMFQDSKFHIVMGNDENVNITNISHNKTKSYVFKEVVEAKKTDCIGKLKGKEVKDTSIKEDKAGQEQSGITSDKEEIFNATKEDRTNQNIINQNETQAFFFSMEEETTAMEKGITGKDENINCITINKELIVKEEANGTIQTRIPKTWGNNIQYLVLEKGTYEKIHQGKTIRASLLKDKMYNLYGKNGQVVSSVVGEQIYQHYDRVAQESRKINAAKNSNQSVTKKEAPHTTKKQEGKQVQNRKVRR